MENESLPNTDLYFEKIIKFGWKDEYRVSYNQETRLLATLVLEE